MAGAPTFYRLTVRLVGVEYRGDNVGADLRCALVVNREETKPGLGGVRAGQSVGLDHVAYVGTFSGPVAIPIRADVIETEKHLDRGTADTSVRVSADVPVLPVTLAVQVVATGGDAPKQGRIELTFSFSVDERRPSKEIRIESRRVRYVDFDTAELRGAADAPAAWFEVGAQGIELLSSAKRTIEKEAGRIEDDTGGRVRAEVVVQFVQTTPEGVERRGTATWLYSEKVGWSMEVAFSS